VAHPTLTVLSLPECSQVLGDRALARSDQILARAKLSPCCHEYPESSYGASDGGFPCYELATVHHLASELEYCEEHFEEVCR
jgi:hypothetical protein